MARSILAVFLGYVCMAAFVMTTVSLTWLGLGPSFGFETGTTRVTNRWALLALVLGALGALVGGWIAALVARRAGPVTALAAVVLVLGLVLAALQPGYDPDRARTIVEGAGGVENVALSDMAEVAEQPAWYNWTIPFVGAIGVLAGGRLRRGGSPPTA